MKLSEIESAVRCVRNANKKQMRVLIDTVKTKVTQARVQRKKRILVLTR